MDEIIHPDGNKISINAITWDILAPLVDEYIQLKDFAEPSQRSIRNTIKRLIEWMGQTASPTPLGLRQAMIEAGMARTYVASTISILRRFWGFLIEKGKTTHNPFDSIMVRGATTVRPRQALSIEQVVSLLRVLEAEKITTDVSKLRAVTITNLMLRTGVRGQAVKDAEIGDLDTNEELPKLWIRHKGHRSADNFVLLFPKTMEFLTLWLKFRPSTVDSALFVSSFMPYKKLSGVTMYRDVTSILKLAGVTDRTPHCLRHTAITLARQAGADLDSVMGMAGHVDPKTTLIYDHSLRRIENAAEKILEKALQQTGVQRVKDTREAEIVNRAEGTGEPRV
jgi:site-specific recombinase XerD